MNRALRGKIRGTFRVYETNDSGRATFDWVQGRDYLLFSFPIIGAAGDLGTQWLRQFWSARQGEHGIGRNRRNSKQHAAAESFTASSVSRRYQPRSPGFASEAQGPSGRYAATTNEKGEFQLSVPVGRYVVRASKEGANFDKADISYEDPRNVRIEPGGCAQVQFARIERPPASVKVGRKIDAPTHAFPEWKLRSQHLSLGPDSPIPQDRSEDRWPCHGQRLADYDRFAPRLAHSPGRAERRRLLLP